MIECADTPICLRATILQYFGEPAVRERCESCGNCRPGAIDACERELVRKILRGIADAGERYGRNRIIAMLTGKVGDLPPSLTKASTVGALRHEAPDTLRDWIQVSIAAGLVAVSQDQYRTLRLTETGSHDRSGRGARSTVDKTSATITILRGAALSPRSCARVR
ncbi:MAG TPA: RQC domain-containing protein [Vicinamibacterales bacterium]|nr:RQC domain-containing protein [Vicinamibacterales bacterium]